MTDTHVRMDEDGTPRWDSKHQGQVIEVDRHGEGVVKWQIGGRTYEQKTVAQCDTCQSVFRHAIESGLLMGLSYRTIVSRLPNDAPEDEVPSRESMTNHIRKHMDAAASVSSIYLNARIKEKGLDLDQIEGALVDRISLSQMIIADVYQRWQRGEIEAPSWDEAFKAAGILQKYEDQLGGETDNQAWMAIVNEILTEVSRGVLPDQMDNILERMNKNESIQAFADKLQQKQQAALPE